MMVLESINFFLDMAQETWQGTWGHDWRVGESELAGNKRILWIHSCAAAAGWYADVGVILPSHHGLIYIHIHYVLAVIGRLTMGEGLKEHVEGKNYIFKGKKVEFHLCTPFLVYFLKRILNTTRDIQNTNMWPPSTFCQFLNLMKSFYYVVVSTGMETFCGQWLLVETFFQNGPILVDIFRGWIFVDIFWVNSSTHFLMVITNSANTALLISQHRGCGGKAPAWLRKHCSVSG